MTARPRAREWAALGIVAGAALALRTVPLLAAVFRETYVNFQDSDAWYHMRLVDSLVHNFPRRITVDPYAAPGGADVPVAPLFDFVVAAAAWAIGLGSPAPHTVDTVGAVAPAVLGAAVTVPVFLLGRRLFGAMAGLLAAALVAVLPGHFLARSLLGFTDHHVLEALLATVAVLGLTTAVQAPGSPLGRSGLAGLALGAYLLTWTGGALLVAVVALWAVAQTCLDAARGRSGHPPAMVAAPALAVALAMVLAFHDPRLWRYGTQVAALGGALGGLVVLETLRRGLDARGAPRAALPAALAGVGAAGALGFWWLAPGLAATVLADLRRFTPAATAFTVNEVRPLLFMPGHFSLARPLELFGTALPLGVGALAVLAARVVARGEAAGSLLAVWSLAMVLATLGQNRFGYYLVVNLALLVGWAGARVIEWAGRPRAPRGPTRAARRRPGRAAVPPGAWRLGAAALVALVALVPNVPASARIARADLGLTPGWHAALAWVRTNTPEPFPDRDYYLARYLPGQTAPPGYTVMAWWDYGYEIIRAARRVPVANPTQAGAVEAARFFAATREADALRALAAAGARYVLADRELPMLPVPGGKMQGKFANVLPWAGLPLGRFWEAVSVREGRGPERMVVLFYPDYYRSMAVHLGVFGGREVRPRESWVFALTERAGPDGRRVASEARKFDDWEEAQAWLAAAPDRRVLAGVDPRRPCVPLPALERLRLVYDAPDAVRAGAVPSVRVFEVVDR